MADLHPLELKVLEALRREKREMTAEELSKAAGLETAAATRAAFWLSAKGLCEVKEEAQQAYVLTKRGQQVLADGLPEKNVLHAIAAEALSMGELYALFGREPLNAALGRLRSAGLVKMPKEPNRVALTITPPGSDWLSKKSDLEFALESVKTGRLPYAKCQKELLERGFAEKSVRKSMSVSLTPAGTKADLIGAAKPGKIGPLTSAMLESGEWKNPDFPGFREYSVDSPSEPVCPGRLHPLRNMIEMVRRAFLNMGFTEASGPWVESAFWCFDALFQPQDHPARDMADTFYMKVPNKIPLPENELVARVKGAHEHGVAGSTGWRYRWLDEVAKSAVLRTHTTSVSARALHSGIKPPAKIFCVGKVFRNETLDYKHLSEHHQVEGIVFDPKVNFIHLLGYLKTFLSFLGFERVRFRPAYFPYTELSVEPEVFVEEKGEWMELGGAGIFRPEVVVPLTGVDCPVLAWGLGIDRLAMVMFGLKDIRDLYRNDMGWLRTSSFFGGKVK